MTLDIYASQNVLQKLGMRFEREMIMGDDPINLRVYAIDLEERGKGV